MPGIAQLHPQRIKVQAKEDISPREDLKVEVKETPRDILEYSHLVKMGIKEDMVKLKMGIKEDMVKLKLKAPQRDMAREARQVHLRELLEYLRWNAGHVGSLGIGPLSALV